MVAYHIFQTRSSTQFVQEPQLKKFSRALCECVTVHVMFNLNVMFNLHVILFIMFLILSYPFFPFNPKQWELRQRSGSWRRRVQSMRPPIRAPVFSSEEAVHGRGAGRPRPGGAGRSREETEDLRRIPWPRYQVLRLRRSTSLGTWRKGRQLFITKSIRTYLSIYYYYNI